MQPTMMRFPLTLTHFLERATRLFPYSPIVSRLPDKSSLSVAWLCMFEDGAWFADGCSLQRAAEGCFTRRRVSAS